MGARLVGEPAGLQFANSGMSAARLPLRLGLFEIE
jgi:hypothetical protein